MKIIIAFIIVLTVATNVNAQGCPDVKTGTFRITADEVNPNESILIRTNDIQIEDIKSKGIKLQFQVKWTSECTYELYKGKVLKGEVPWMADDQVLYVKITNVTPTYYSAEITSNFSDMKLVKDIQIVKKIK